MEIRPHATLDTCGTLCPVPIHLTSKKIREMKPGEILEVLSDDVGILTDMPAWCRATGHQILREEHESGETRYYLRINQDLR